MTITYDANTCIEDKSCTPYDNDTSMGEESCIPFDYDVSVGDESCTPFDYEVWEMSLVLPITDVLYSLITMKT